MSKDREIQKRLALHAQKLPSQAKLLMGEGSYGSPALRGRLSTVRIGKYCSIADNVTFDAGENHNTGNISTYPFNILFPAECGHIKTHPVTKGDITVGHDVWIAAGAYILGGVVVGHGAVIGGRAVVSRNVEPYAVAVGNPARTVGYRFSPEDIEKLLMLKWWDWPRAKILKHVELLMSGNVDALIRASRKKK